MIYKIINSIVAIAIVGAIVAVIFALQMSFSTVNKNININKEDIKSIHGNQENIVDNLLELTAVAEAMSNQIYIQGVELEKLKHQAGQPNDLDEKAEELFNILAEE